MKERPRKSLTMGKKRKGGRGTSSINVKTQAPADNSRLVINSYEDVADSEDEFHIARDKILLEEGPARKRQRKLGEDGKLAPWIFELREADIS